MVSTNLFYFKVWDPLIGKLHNQEGYLNWGQKERTDLLVMDPLSPEDR